MNQKSTLKNKNLQFSHFFKSQLDDSTNENIKKTSPKVGYSGSLLIYRIKCYIILTVQVESLNPANITTFFIVKHFRYDILVGYNKNICELHQNYLQMHQSDFVAFVGILKFKQLFLIIQVNNSLLCIFKSVKMFIVITKVLICNKYIVLLLQN